MSYSEDILIKIVDFFHKYLDLKYAMTEIMKDFSGRRLNEDEKNFYRYLKEKEYGIK